MNDLTIEQKTIHKLNWRLMPFILLIYFVCMMDRSNISYAALTMNQDLAITATMFGLITGIFFIGYAVFVVPSTIAMYKLGAKKYLTIILIVWGFVCIAMAFAQNEYQLLVLRFVLGLVEAGFYSTIVLMMTMWFPQKYLARNITKLAIMSVVTGIVLGPISGLILEHAVGWLGMESWRWLFILQALPAVICGIIAPIILSNKPEQAKFLTNEQREWLVAQKIEEEAEKAKADASKVKVSKWQVLKMPLLWLIAIAAFTCTMAAYGVTMWLPLMLKSLGEGLPVLTITLLTVIPYLVGGIVGFINGWHSDKTLERRFHVAIPLIALTVGLIGAAITTNLFLSIAFLSIACAGFVSFNGSFFTIPTAVMGEAAAVIGISVINLITNLGGFFGPTIVGAVQESTGSLTSGLFFLGIATFIGAIIVLAITKPKKTMVDKKSNEAKSLAN